MASFAWPSANITAARAVARTISIGLAPLGLFLGGVLLDRLSGPPTLVLTGSVAVGVALVFSFSTRLRTAR